jgi:hypothetical protein
MHCSRASALQTLAGGQAAVVFHTFLGYDRLAADGGPEIVRVWHGFTMVQKKYSLDKYTMNSSPGQVHGCRV